MTLLTDTQVTSLSDYLVYLHNRWIDEREYEDFNEYRKAMSNKLAENGCKMIKFTKRPWQIVFTMSDGSRKWMKVRGDTLEWGGYR